MRGTGFEPEQEMLARSTRCAFLAGFSPAILFSSSLSLGQKMRGTGFEPADSYETAS